MASAAGNKVKVIITVPQLSRPGGVSALYNIARLDNIDGIDYFQIHGFGGKNPLTRIFDLIYIYLKFAFQVVKYDVVESNPSLASKSFFRDAIFIYISLLFNKKVIVYWHGWNDDYEEKINKTGSLKKIFLASYGQAHLNIVLGSVFKSKLIAMGVTSKIIVESNTATDEFIATEHVLPKKIEDGKLISCLFLARIEVEKGIYIAIDAIRLLSKDLKIKLVVGGDGSALSDVKKYVAEHKIENIEFAGYVNGKAKHALLASADLFIFPTYHKEGMPINLIEAMLYGLPLISTSVGGIPDWVEDGKNGFLLNSLEPKDYAETIKKLLENKTLYYSISKNNVEKADKFFKPHAFNQRMLSYYQSIKLNS